jgi:hypothetical protein
VPGTVEGGIPQHGQPPQKNPGLENQLPSVLAEKDIVASPVPPVLVRVPDASDVPLAPALIVPDPAVMLTAVTVNVKPLLVYVAPIDGDTVTPETVN